MSSKRKPSKAKKINPHFWVFCEGETEDAYIQFLRREHRLTIEIVSKVAGCEVSERYIRTFKKGQPTHEKDRNFLIYDADVPEVLEKLKKISSAVLIASNPAIELWFLLHYKNQTATLSEDTSIKELSNRNRNEYKKGKIDDVLEEKLKEKCTDACSRAKRLLVYNNPSTNAYILIETLENAKINQV